MSLAIMFYKQPNRRRRQADAAIRSKEADTVAEGFVRIDRTRSVGFPIVISVAIIVALISIFHSTVTAAATGEQKLFCHSTDSAADIVIAEARVKNIGSKRASVLCAVDLPPSISAVSASILLEETGASLTTRCMLNARGAFGGQARSVSLKALDGSEESGHPGWLVSAALNTAMDDFHYISCELAPGAAITGLRASAHNIPVALRSARRLGDDRAMGSRRTAFVTLQR